jgi:excisionase family DNA binding protein
MTTKLLTVPETAARLGVQRNTVYRLIKAGALRTVDIAATGKKARARVREDDLAAFIESRTASVETPTVDDALAATS